MNTVNFNLSKLPRHVFNSPLEAARSLIIRMNGQALAKSGDNKYDVAERLEKVFDYINSLGHFDNIIVCNTGDSLDGMDKMTVRRDHLLEQNLNNKEQVLTYIKAMTDFMVSLKTITEQVSYYCVGESNHKF